MGRRTSRATEACAARSASRGACMRARDGSNCSWLSVWRTMASMGGCWWAAAWMAARMMSSTSTRRALSRSSSGGGDDMRAARCPFRMDGGWCSGWRWGRDGGEAAILSDRVGWCWRRWWHCTARPLCLGAALGSVGLATVASESGGRPNFGRETTPVCVCYSSRQRRAPWSPEGPAGPTHGPTS